jgi:hypothetical protein
MRSNDEFKQVGVIDLSIRIAQLIVSIIALAVGISAYYLGSTALLVITLVGIAVILVLGITDREKNSWYQRLKALHSLRLKMEFSEEPLKGTIRTLYRSGLETNYQYALLEKRMELANHLKDMLDNLTN